MHVPITRPYTSSDSPLVQVKQIKVSPEDRKAALSEWFRQLSAQVPELSGFSSDRAFDCISGDASFRRYFRVSQGPRSVMLMDAPPDREAVTPFLTVADRLRQAGVSVPRVLAADIEQGFVCLEDFGDELLLSQLRKAAAGGDHARATTLYHACFEELLLVQSADAGALPVYDEALLQREMALFRDWLCEGWLGLSLNAGDRDILNACFEQLVEAALMQPQGFVHRDFHSRNLMYRADLASGVLASGALTSGALTPGVLDFQDAVRGPLTYDLVSLLKDCYIAWPREQVHRWVMEYLALARGRGLLSDSKAERFWQDFELMGVQRHLKAAGIFARLYLRDDKPGYLGDIPRTLGYIESLGADYEHIPALQDFRVWMRQRVLPVMESRLRQREASQG